MLSLITLLNFMSTDFCASRAKGLSTAPAAFVAFSRAQDKFGGAEVRRVITTAPGVEAAAVAAVVAKCPNRL
jgi:hypothetical protein